MANILYPFRSWIKDIVDFGGGTHGEAVLSRGHPAIVSASFNNSGTIATYAAGRTIAEATPTLKYFTVARPRGRIIGTKMIVATASGTFPYAAAAFNLMVAQYADFATIIGSVPADNEAAAYSSTANGLLFRDAQIAQFSFVVGGWTNGYGLTLGASVSTSVAYQEVKGTFDEMPFDLTGQTGVEQTRLYYSVGTAAAFACGSIVDTFVSKLLIKYD